MVGIEITVAALRWGLNRYGASIPSWSDERRQLVSGLVVIGLLVA